MLSSVSPVPSVVDALKDRPQRTQGPQRVVLPLFQTHPVEVVPARHVGKYDLVAFFQTLQEFDRIHRAAPQLNLGTPFASAGYHLLRWDAAGLTYWAVSDLNPSDLERLARLLRQTS